MTDISDKNTSDDVLVTRKECAAYFGIHERSWDRWERIGKAPRRCTPPGVNPRWRIGDIRAYFLCCAPAESTEEKKNDPQTV